MSNTNDKPDPTRVTVDFIGPIIAARSDCPNELTTLRTLHSGLNKICSMVKRREVAFAEAGGDKFIVHQFGATSDAEQDLLDTVACFFHWFGVSVCNYARLTGFVRGIALGHFKRADLRDSGKFKSIKASIDEYVATVSELREVMVWRNKVFGHFAITDPRKDDNIATLDMSVISPITFDGRYCVGGMTMTRSGPGGSFTSELPEWSITRVFESLIPRYWPGTAFVKKPPEGQQDAPKTDNDR
jgi:hypothetical protein